MATCKVWVASKDGEGVGRKRAKRKMTPWMKEVQARVWDLWPRLHGDSTKLLQINMVKTAAQGEFFASLVEYFAHRIRQKYQVTVDEVRNYLYT